MNIRRAAFLAAGLLLTTGWSARAYEPPGNAAYVHFVRNERGLLWSALIARKCGLRSPDWWRAVLGTIENATAEEAVTIWGDGVAARRASSSAMNWLLMQVSAHSSEPVTPAMCQTVQHAVHALDPLTTIGR